MLGNANAHELPSNCFRGSRLVSIYRWTNCRLLQIYAGSNSADCAHRPIWVRKRENHPPSCHRSSRHSSQTATGKQLEDLLKSELQHCVRLFCVWTSSEFDAIVLSHRAVPRASSIRLDSKSPTTRRQVIGHPTTKNYQPPDHQTTRPPDHFLPNPSTDQNGPTRTATTEAGGDHNQREEGRELHQAGEERRGRSVSVFLWYSQLDPLSQRSDDALAIRLLLADHTVRPAESGRGVHEHRHDRRRAA